MNYIDKTKSKNIIKINNDEYKKIFNLIKIQETIIINNENDDSKIIIIKPEFRKSLENFT